MFIANFIFIKRNCRLVGTVFNFLSIKMENRQDNDNSKKLPGADSGNASNPSPHQKDMEPANSNQLLDERAEKYLRESANIEDMPDAQDQLEAEKNDS